MEDCLSMFGLRGWMRRELATRGGEGEGRERGGRGEEIGRAHV